MGYIKAPIIRLPRLSFSIRRVLSGLPGFKSPDLPL